MDATCSACGKALSGSDIMYTEDAKVICAACSAEREIKRDEKRAAGNIKIAAVTSLLAGAFGLAGFMVAFDLFFWAGAVISISAAIFAFKPFAVPGSERFTAYLSQREKLMIYVLAGLAFAIAGFEVLGLRDIIHIPSRWRS